VLSPTQAARETLLLGLLSPPCRAWLCYGKWGQVLEAWK